MVLQLVAKEPPAPLSFGRFLICRLTVQDGKVILHQIFSLKKSDRYLLPALGWLILSTVLLTLPQSAFRGGSWFSKIPWFDKWVHIGMFGIMAVLLCWGIFKRKSNDDKLKTYFIWAGCACLAYGVAMEFVQKFWVPFRSFDAGDVVADGVGAAAGVIFSFQKLVKK
jgi:VanZ family protein